MDETTFYCCWCSRRKPVSNGYREMSRRRKKCTDCQHKSREAKNELAKQRAHARQE